MQTPEPLGRNQAMRMILGQAQEDEANRLRRNLIELKNQIRLARLSEDKLKLIRFELNEILSNIAKELMNGQADSRIPHLSTRSEEERTSGSADRIEL